MRIVINAQTGEQTTDTDSPIDSAAVTAEQARFGKANALRRISEIRAELSEHLATVTVGTPSEQGVARAAIGTLRAELALNKAKL